MFKLILADLTSVAYCVAKATSNDITAGTTEAQRAQRTAKTTTASVVTRPRPFPKSVQSFDFF
jgi:hypothetical protein